MDSDEEILSFLDSEIASSPVPQRKLKRLKKATHKVTLDTDRIPPNDDISPPIDAQNSSEDLPANEESWEGIEEPAAGSETHLDGFEEVNDLGSGFGGSGVKEGGVKRALEFDGEGEEDRDGETDTEEDLEKNRDSSDVSEKFDGEDEDLIGKVQIEVETEKNSDSLDELKEGKEKKRKKKRSESGVDDDDELASSTAHSKRREEKERRERIQELRAENQRLLRESRDASFKPVPLVQKAVSSVLEKIRKRKLEISQKLVNANASSHIYGDGDFDFENASIGDSGKSKVAKADDKETAASPVEENLLDSLCAEEANDTANGKHESVHSQVAQLNNFYKSEDLDEDPRETFRAPVNDTQDLTFDFETSDSKDEMPSSPREEASALSLRTMNLKFDSAPPEDDYSSDEEYNDKENIDSRPQCVVNPSSPRGDPVKAFVDEEAEEEDDSDNDLHRFQDDEEEGDDTDTEELNDMIASGYEERPVDNEMRNELHQKWLEQQDAVGTENLLQRFKRGSKQVETTMLEDKEASEREEDEGDSLNEGDSLDDEDAECIDGRNLMRMNLKKAKEMMSQMFTDKDDVYISSDEEETETQLDRRCTYDRTEAQGDFLSPAEVEGSKEIFGLIKKLNGIADNKKKAKVTSYLHMASMNQNKTMTSKSSFLSRKSKYRLSSSRKHEARKHESSTFRSYVFGRDDSNHKSSTSIPEDSSSDLTQMENRPRKTASARFTSSQNRSSTQNTQTATKISSGPSLHEILRRPSTQSSNWNHNSMVGQVETFYAAFKLDKNLITKKQPDQNLIRKTQPSTSMTIA